MEEQTTNNTGEGNKPEATSIVERADSIAKRLEDSEKRIDEKLKQLQDLEARRVLGGRAEAGQAPIVKEETAKEYANRIMKNNIPLKANVGK